MVGGESKVAGYSRFRLPPAVQPMVEVASIPTKNFTEVIEVRVPVRFFWEGDVFDGIEFGPFTETLQEWQEDMIKRCLLATKGGD